MPVNALISEGNSLLTFPPGICGLSVVSAVIFYSWWLWVLLFHTIILSNAIKPLPQVGSELGGNKWKACVSPEVAARQIRTGKHSHLWRHSALLPPKPEPRAADQEYRLHVEPLCEPARWWAGQGKMAQNFPPISKLPSSWFSIHMVAVKLCFLESWQSILTVSACFFCCCCCFFPGGGESLEPSTPPFLIKSLPLLLLSTPKYHRVSTECSEFCLLSHVHNYISSDWPNTLTNKNEHGGHCFKMTE